MVAHRTDLIATPSMVVVIHTGFTKHRYGEQFEELFTVFQVLINTMALINIFTA